MKNRTKPNKTRFGILLLLILTILITAFIFSNSLKNGEESNAQSAPIVEVVEKVLDPEDKIPTKTFNYIVRKAAHIAEYTVLGLWLGGLMKIVAGRHKDQPIVMSLIIGGVIATIDEIIQSFTGRTNSITDVLIDLVGVSIGVGITLLWSGMHNRKSKAKRKA